MSATDGVFAQWLSRAQIADGRLTAEQRGLPAELPAAETAPPSQPVPLPPPPFSRRGRNTRGRSC
jgi:hypothetical protein